MVQGPGSPLQMVQVCSLVVLTIKFGTKTICIGLQDRIVNIQHMHKRRHSPTLSCVNGKHTVSGVYYNLNYKNNPKDWQGKAPGMKIVAYMMQ